MAATRMSVKDAIGAVAMGMRLDLVYFDPNVVLEGLESLTREVRKTAHASLLRAVEILERISEEGAPADNPRTA